MLMLNLVPLALLYVMLAQGRYEASSLHDQMSGESERVLNQIHDITTNNIGSLCHNQQYRTSNFNLNVAGFSSTIELVEFSMHFLKSSHLLKDKDMSLLMLKRLLQTDRKIFRAFFFNFNPSFSIQVAGNTAELRNNTQQYTVETAPWHIDRFPKSKLHSGQWTSPYFSCQTKSWLISYALPFVTQMNDVNRLNSLMVVDFNISHMDINQCEDDQENDEEKTIDAFQNTHKCHNASMCLFEPGHGWVRGGYICQCKDGFYSTTGKNYFNGSLVEVAYMDSVRDGSETYSLLYQCRPCSPGCSSCTDDSPCLAVFNWNFRSVLLGISVFCIAASLVMIVLVYNYRRVKVFKYSSPTFLCITLLGCAIMFSEMVAIYPELNVYMCIMTKWTRHFGFCVTYTALLMKTWRVSLTYRVKSAHKLKLTDKQLLQWMLPILLIMFIYLAAWCISDPPDTVDLVLEKGERFKICRYNWWDHSLALGEILFLLWGVKVCFSVRKARTYFDEAKLISWSIYNIAIVNIVMAALHIKILRHAGPDVKYFLGFLRTQLSTTSTLLLVFGPKFSRLLSGKGNDSGEEGRGPTSIIGIPYSKTEQMDVHQENEELKEELQKLAAKVEVFKIIGMMASNRHAKPGKTAYFSPEYLAQQVEISNSTTPCAPTVLKCSNCAATSGSSSGNQRTASVRRTGVQTLPRSKTTKVTLIEDDEVIPMNNIRQVKNVKEHKY